MPLLHFTSQHAIGCTSRSSRKRGALAAKVHRAVTGSGSRLPDEIDAACLAPEDIRFHTKLAYCFLARRSLPAGHELKDTYIFCGRWTRHRSRLICSTRT